MLNETQLKEIKANLPKDAVRRASEKTGLSQTHIRRILNGDSHWDQNELTMAAMHELIQIHKKHVRRKRELLKALA